MANIPNETLVTVVLGLQFAAFGWRINREIEVGDQGRRTWFPISDWLNVLSMIGLVAACIIGPISGNYDNVFAPATLAVSSTLIAMHPINTAAHYRLNTSSGRHKYTEQKRDFPYVTDWEIVSLCITIVLVGITIWLVAFVPPSPR